MGLFSTKSSSSSSSVTSQTTTTNVGGNSQFAQDFSELFGKSVINTGTYGEASKQSLTSVPSVYVEPSLSSSTTQRNDSSATSALGLGNPGEMIGAIADGATGGLGSTLGSVLGAGIGAAFNSGSSSDYGYYTDYGYNYNYDAYNNSSSSGSVFLPLLIGGVGIAAAWFLL